ncbi:MAG TPA: S53 family peptidase [Gaiellaceae bacterium]
MKSFGWTARRRTGALLAIATLLLLVAAAAADGATSSQSGAAASAKVAVPQGIGTSALNPASAFGPTPASTPETVSFILKAQNLGGLEANVEAGMPGGYLSVGQFARQYGQPQYNIGALENYLSRYGIATSAYADGLDVTATGTAGEFDAALSVNQSEFSVPAIPARLGHPGRPGMNVHGTKQSPLLPRQLAQFVLAILGLSNYPTFGSDAVHTPSPAGATSSKVQLANLTPADFAKQYNLNGLHGATGAGTTIGIVTLASVDPSVAQYFWSNILDINTLPNRISLVNVDGGSGPVSNASGSDETTLDVEQSGGLAPKAKIVVYQAPNTDFGFVDAFFDAASQNVADTLSASWGESETVIQASVNIGIESPTYAITFDEAYLESAAQGQSAFVSAGDFGAYTAAEDLGTTNLSAGNPDSSPWITSAGGTTLPGTIPVNGPDGSANVTIHSERTWGWDWLWPEYALFGYPTEAAYAASLPIGGGGGFSVDEATPQYQELIPSAHSFSATEYLTPTDYQSLYGLNLPTAWNFNAAPPVTTGYGTGRATPDVSTDADPYTGYEVYYTFGDGPAVLEDGWGGTSFVAPQLNGSTAVIDSALGHRVGFWNPAIYQFATQRNSPFNPLDSASANNDNLYYTGTPGHLYNVGSGLGTPDLAQLASDFAFTHRR